MPPVVWLLVGGLLQSVTFIIGIKALLLIVAGLYIAATLTRPRRLAEETDSTTQATATPIEEPEPAAPTEEIVQPMEV